MTSATERGAGRFDDLRAATALVFPAPDRVLRAARPDQVVGLLSDVQQFTDEGGWAFGYLAYEAAAGLQPEMAVHQSTPQDMPLAWFGLGGPPTEVPAVSPVEGRGDPPEFTASWHPAWGADDHRRQVISVKQRIRVGDTYQINLTERMHGIFTGDPFALYRDLALGQRGAYNAYLDLGEQVIASASPELFFERRGDAVLLRPMKGTIPRGRTLEEDRARAHRLRSSEKERAENVMIVDLLRNDVSRIAVTGTVGVPALFTVERYETVLQLTSDVTAELRPRTGLVDVLTALFPCGSVTGAPKLSSMEIIRDLETTPRGVYCGTIGFVAPPTEAVRARFSVAIRTAVLDTATGKAVYGTGGGITWDSDPDAEQAEVVAKAAVLLVRPTSFRLFETMRYEPGSGLRNRRRHLNRLADSAEYLGFSCDLAAIGDRLDERLDNEGASRVRLSLNRAGEVGIDVEPLPPDLGRAVTLCLDEEPVDQNDWRLFHKISRRAPYEVRSHRHPHADDVIMINAAGELTETTRASLAVELGGRWWTPPQSSGLLPGIERARLLDLGTLQEKVLRRSDLESAEGLAVISSLRGWRTAELAPEACSHHQPKGGLA